MSKQDLAAIAKAMVAPGKGLLAMDESNRTCNKRFEEVGIAPTVENRRAYRELILTTAGLGDSHQQVKDKTKTFDLSHQRLFC